MENRVFFIMRHATATTKGHGQNDFQRPLSEIGKKEALFMAETLKEQNISLDYLICSPARRTMETLRIMQSKLCEKQNLDIVESPHLYDGGVEAYVKAIAEIPKACQQILLVGHNPDISYLVETWIGKSLDFSPATCVAIHGPSATNYTVFSCESMYSAQDSDSDKRH